MKRPTLPKSAQLSLLCNLLFAVGHCAVGFWTGSWWFVTLGAYYTILSVARFCLMRMYHHAPSDENNGPFVQKVTGVLFLFLALCLVGVVILSAVKDRGKQLHEIIMIAMATYSFSRVGLAIRALVLTRKDASPVIKSLRNISLATALVSIYGLQRSMLVSFPGMEKRHIQLFNILTGSALCIAVALLGIFMIGGKPITMAKSKLVKAVQTIGSAVTDGYKKIETGAVSGYKAVERGVVSGYTKLEDKFVEAYLTKDGETVEEAKERLRKQS